VRHLRACSQAREIRPRIASPEATIDLENRNKLLVRLTTLQEAINARRQKRAPRFED